VPKLVDHEARRRDIAEAAADLIAARGLDGATSAALARAAGCTVGALPHYFQGKETILLAALRAVNESLERRATARAARPGADLCTLLEAALPVDAPGRRDNRVWFAFAGRALQSEELAIEYRRRYRELEARAEALLDPARLPESWTPTLAMQSLFAFIDGLALRALIDRRRWTGPGQRQLLRQQMELLGIADSLIVGPHS